MAVLALVLMVVFAMLSMGWRAWLQRRRTGSSGVLAFRARVGTPEWFASSAFSGALATLLAGPVLEALGVVHPLVSHHATWPTAAGITLAVAGMAATVYAQLAMGDSWRLGVDSGATTTLVHRGVFGWVRNPIYTAMLVFAAGVTLLTPNIVTTVGLVLLIVAIELVVRLVEEPYLRSKHGDDYRRYTADVGRFVPWIGRAR